MDIYSLVSPEKRAESFKITWKINLTNTRKHFNVRLVSRLSWKQHQVTCAGYTSQDIPSPRYVPWLVRMLATRKVTPRICHPLWLVRNPWTCRWCVPSLFVGKKVGTSKKVGYVHHQKKATFSFFSTWPPQLAVELSNGFLQCQIAIL